MIDRQTIQQAIVGEASALRTVLEGLQERAWWIARDFTEDWDETEGLAQEILVETARSLPRLQEPERIGSWFATLGRRVCLGWKQREKRRQLILGDWRIEDPSVASCPFAEPEAALLAEEWHQSLREALGKVGTQTRKALELFYLGGLSLRKIASELGITENTVKQRLYWGRHCLQKEMWTMPVTTEVRQEPAVEPLLRFLLWGDAPASDSPYNPQVLTRSLLVQQILLQIAQEARTVEEIAAAVGAEQIYVVDHLAALSGAELVHREEGERYIAAFFILDRKAQMALDERVREVGWRDAELFAARVSEMSDAVERCGLADRGFDWDCMRWIVLCVLLANLGMRQAQPEVYRLCPPLQPDGRRRFFFGRTRDIAEPRWVAGCNRYYDGDNQDGGVGEFWTPPIRKSDFFPGSQALRTVFALVNGARSLEDVVNEAGSEEARTIAAELVEKGFCVREDEQLRLTIPAFTEAEDQILYPVVERVCREVLAQSPRPKIEEVNDLLDGLGYGRLRDQYPVIHSHTSSAISAYCTEAMVEMGLLGEPPEEVPGTWGCWAWRGKVRLMN